MDSVLEQIGEFGRFQKVLLLLLSPFAFYSSQILVMYFAAISPTWRCTANSSVCVKNETFSKDNNERCTMNRSDWEFTEDDFFSIATQFDLSCEREWLISLSSSLFFVAWAFGGLTIGWVADRYGRKRVLLPANFLFYLICFGTAFSPNIETVLVLRSLAGFLVPLTGLQAFIILTEYTSEKYRPLVGGIFYTIVGFAELLTPILGYFLRQWKSLYIVLSAPFMISILLYTFIPESSRWLLLNGKTKEVERIIERIAKFNQKAAPQFLFHQYSDDTQVKSNYLDLFKTKRELIYLLVQSYGFVVCGVVSFGFSFAAEDLGGSLYMNSVQVALAAFLSASTFGYFCHKIGRKKTVISSLFLGTSACFLIPFLKSRNERVIIGMIGKYFINVTFNAFYIWSSEIFPTSTRSSGMGLLQFSGFFGSSLAPFVVNLLKKIHPSVPFILSSILGFTSFAVLFVLPETKGKKTREVIDQNEKVEMLSNITSTAELTDCKMIEKLLDKSTT